MGLYNVVEPCAAANVQYVRPTPEFQPVEIDDEVAAPLVAEGSLTPYAPGAESSTSEDDALAGKLDVTPEPSARAKRPRGGVDA